MYIPFVRGGKFIIDFLLLLLLKTKLPFKLKSSILFIISFVSIVIKLDAGLGNIRIFELLL